MRRGKAKGMRGALMAAVACHALIAGHPLFAQEAQGDVDWGPMTLEAVSGLLRVSLPRPPARPEGFAATINYGAVPRPQGRPYWLEAPQDVTQVLPSTVDAPQTVPDALVAGVATEPEITAAPVLLDPVEPVVVADPPPAPEAPPAVGPILVEQPSLRPPAEPSSEPVAAPVPPLAGPLLPPAPALAAMGTSDFSTSGFKADRARLELAYVEAEEGPPKIKASLEVARLLISQMLLPEARDYHRRAQGMGVILHPDLHGPWRVQGAMLDVLQGRAWQIEMPEGWAEASLWGAAGSAPAGKVAGEVSLLDGVAMLQNHSEPVIAELLPKLFNAALAQGDLRIADSLLRGAREATHLPDEPVYHLMMGRLALAYDMPKEAFDYFAQAAQGSDLAAQEARIAMADLAIERRDPKLLPALAEILQEGVHQWRHDRAALILRARLAQVAEDLGDIPLALDIMGKIRLDHPGTAEAILAHERGALALAAFAVAVDAGEITLETYLQSLREVESFYRLDPIWPIARMALARAWSRVGLHEAAASEYAALQTDLARIGAPDPQPLHKAEIPLAEAEEWLRNHDLARARVALAREGLPRFADLQERYGIAAIRAEVTGALGHPMAFTTLDGLRTAARGARMAGLLGQAHQAHEALAKAQALSDPPSGAIHATLIARDLGQDQFGQQTFDALQATPEGAASGASPALYQALTLPMPTLAPLSQEKADVMLERTDAALQAARALLARPLPSAAQALGGEVTP